MWLLILRMRCGDRQMNTNGGTSKSDWFILRSCLYIILCVGLSVSHLLVDQYVLYLLVRSCFYYICLSVLYLLVCLSVCQCDICWYVCIVFVFLSVYQCVIFGGLSVLYLLVCLSVENTWSVRAVTVCMSRRCTPRWWWSQGSRWLTRVWRI